MVPDSGAPAGLARLRPLNLPHPITVTATPNSVAPRPLAIRDAERRRRVEHILDTWDVDEEWWRDPLSRRYFQVLLEDGAIWTIYRDQLSGDWFQQHY